MNTKDVKAPFIIMAKEVMIQLLLSRIPIKLNKDNNRRFVLKAHSSLGMRIKGKRFIKNVGRIRIVYIWLNTKGK